jgi:hypothetical protein
VYILDLPKRRWIVKGRFRDALEFEDSVLRFWQKTEFGPTLTIFLENDPEVASAIPPSFLSCRSSSVSKSHSRSSHSSSVSSTAHAASVRHSNFITGQSSVRNSEGPSNLSTNQKEALLTFLGIDTELQHATSSLRDTYKKYKALINATKSMQGLRASQEWPEHLVEHGVEFWVPIFVDLVNVFKAKSQYYSLWKPEFSRVQRYPQMKSWLDDDSDCESDSEIWANTKNPDDYTFADLKEWLNRKDVAKGKRPAVASSSGGKKLVVATKDKKKKKERQEISSEESENSWKEKRSKLKAKSKSKQKSSE